ncbi:MAG: tRNA (adenosine(37)-N6)-threonylcarbamoyltransferase complex ATPase subunit type 1 TsaE, partial [Treponema sp.]|nr:tRNA (adenosine(37)-N6)-threonylcarbamoyltransferase complex ATPase subunit type 1 TsaE [Treponema sp.]
MKMEGSLARIVSSSPEETIAAGERIAAFLHKGSIVALRGGLGVGKTCLTKGIARGLGIREEITSPTYTIVSEYQGT